MNYIVNKHNFINATHIDTFFTRGELAVKQAC